MHSRIERPDDSFETSLDRVLNEMDTGIDNPPKEESVISAFYAGYLASRCIPEVSAQLDDHVAQLPAEMPSSLIVRRFFKRHQAILTSSTQRQQTLYPYNFDKEDTWKSYFQEYHSSFASPHSQRLRHLLWVPLQTNRPERAIVPAFGLAAHKLRHDTQEERVVHDYGSGANMVLESLNVINDLVGATVVAPEDPAEPYAEPLELEEPTLVLKIISNLRSFSRGYGVERRPPRTEGDMLLIKSDTLEPSQFDIPVGPATTNNGYEEQFDYLLTMLNTPSEPRSKIRTIKGDFRRLAPNQEKPLLKHPATIAYLGHVLAGSPSQVAASIDSILPYVEPNGYILVNEYATVDPDNPQNLRILHHWYEEKWQCRTFALRKSHLDEGFIPIFTWETSECHKVRIESGITKLAPRLNVLADSD